MMTGVSILIVGLVFAVIYLYSITRDRWSWKKIILRLSVATSLLLTCLSYFLVRVVSSGFYENNVSLWVLVVGGSITLFLLWYATKKSRAWVIVLTSAYKLAIGSLLFYLAYLSYVTIQVWYADHNKLVTESKEYDAFVRRKDQERMANQKVKDTQEYKAVLSQIKLTKVKIEQLVSIHDGCGLVSGGNANQNKCYQVGFSLLAKNSSDKKITGLSVWWDIFANYPLGCHVRDRYEPKGITNNYYEILNTYGIGSAGIMPGESREIKFTAISEDNSVLHDKNNHIDEILNGKKEFCFDVADIQYADI